MSPQRRRVPPGRAGRLKLRHSLDSAQRGADLLERKLRLLLDKERTLRREADEAGRLWQTRLAEAETWLVRGVLIGGEQALAQAVPADLARVEIEWTSLMGVTYPSAVSWRAPARSPWIGRPATPPSPTRKTPTGPRYAPPPNTAPPAPRPT
ncbi:V-type ATP synthase subunit D [Streptomyces mexicanus]